MVKSSAAPRPAIKKMNMAIRCILAAPAYSRLDHLWNKLRRSAVFKDASQKHQEKQMSKAIVNGDGIDRRGFLRCMAWAGTGVVWTIAGGVPTSRAFWPQAPADSKAGLSFV